MTASMWCWWCSLWFPVIFDFDFEERKVAQSCSFPQVVFLAGDMLMVQVIGTFEICGDRRTVDFSRKISTTTDPTTTGEYNLSTKLGVIVGISLIDTCQYLIKKWNWNSNQWQRIVSPTNKVFYGEWTLLTSFQYNLMDSSKTDTYGEFYSRAHLQDNQVKPNGSINLQWNDHNRIII